MRESEKRKVDSEKLTAEDGKQKTRFLIFPNPNQVILLRKIQKELCQKNPGAVPSYPICIKCDDLQKLEDKVTKAGIEDFFIEENKIFLSIGMEVNGKLANGRLELCKIDEEMPVKIQCDIQFKKISPFRIAETQIGKKENGIVWHVLREKWGKA